MLELNLSLPLQKVTHSAAMIDTVCTIPIRKKGGSVLFFFSIAMTEQEEPAGRRQDDKKDPHLNSRKSSGAMFDVDV